MTGLLTAVAVVATLALVVSATHTASKATARDPQRRGTWGIARWTRQHHRSLNPHERRWQTALLSSRDNNARWADLVGEIHRLERLSSLELSTDVPPRPNTKWLESRIARLEMATDTEGPGEPIQ